jgi:ketosteroid isomerase-like protein
MGITRRHFAAAGALALAAASLPAQAETADEAAVKKALDDLAKAMMAADKAGLEAMVADQLSFGHTTGRIQGKADFVAEIADKKTIYKSITPTELTVAVMGNNAIARHIDTVEAQAGERAISLKLVVLQVWVKDGGAWKLLAHQGTKI